MKDSASRRVARTGPTAQEDVPVNIPKLGRTSPYRNLLNWGWLSIYLECRNWELQEM